MIQMMRVIEKKFNEKAHPNLQVVAPRWFHWQTFQKAPANDRAKVKLTEKLLFVLFQRTYDENLCRSTYSELVLPKPL